MICIELPEEYKLVSIPARRTLVVLLCCGVITDFSGDGSLSLGFFFSFFSFFFKKTSVALLKLWEVEDYSDLGTPCPRNLIIT